ncbi:MAG: phospholipase D-like domain-containing protein [Saprospiraceae bacterium]|nr:phospholipase D-like domain-containing protein [Saprospiraceae bacterium]
MKTICTLILIAVLAQGLSAQLIFSEISQENITATNFEVAWNTNVDAVPCLSYGTTPSLELGRIVGTVNGQYHRMTLSNLSASTFYYVRPCVAIGTDTFNYPVTFYMTTASNSSGAIEIYFNGTVDASVSNGASPNLSGSGSNIKSKLLDLIDDAQTSIDVAAYNINQDDIIDALEDAVNRGVTVRYVANDGTSNTSLSPAPNFNVLYANANGLMHNKFLIIDGDSVNDSYVWTGSMNLTQGNVYTDFNNVVLIQDQALAKAYTIEFEEMWGSTTATPNAGNSKTGASKTDNIPHLFSIGGRDVELYFSPSDNTTAAIVDALQSAGSNVNFLLLTMTKDELGTTLKDAAFNGVSVNGVIDNVNDLGSEFPDLQTSQANVYADNSSSTSMHHKYAIVDATFPNADPLVVTGSHNWSNAAETENDENTLIIHDNDINNIYYQEFKKRWCEVVGTTNCNLTFPTPVAVDNIYNQPQLASFEVYPNPAQDQITLNINAVRHTAASYSVVDMMGRTVIYRPIELYEGEQTYALSLDGLNTGMYIVHLHLENGDRNSQLLQITK